MNPTSESSGGHGAGAYVAEVIPRTTFAARAFNVKMLGRLSDIYFIIREYLRAKVAATTWAAMLGAVIVILVGVPLSAALNVWIDEAFTLHTTGSGPLYAWEQAIAFEGQPPFYFIVESAWRMLDETSIAFARFPSVLFAASAVAVIVIAARRIAPRCPPLVVALLTAFNPIIIWAAVEMRVYALVLLISAALTWAFFEAFLVAEPARRARIGYLVFAIIGLYTQYYVGFLLAAHFVTLLAFRRKRLTAFCGSMAIVTGAFAPFVSVAMMHVATSAYDVSRVNPLEALLETAASSLMFVLPHELQATAAIKLAGYGLASACIITSLIVGRIAIPEQPARVFVAQWLACIGTFTCFFSAFGAPSDPLRHVIAIAPGSLLVSFLVISSLTRIRMLASATAITAFAALALTQLLHRYQMPLAKPGDWQRVAATLSAKDSRARIAVFPAELALPLGWYLHVKTIPIPKPMPFAIDYVRDTALTGEAQVRQALGTAQVRSAHLWIVTEGSCKDTELAHYDYHCHFLEECLNVRYRIVQSIAFRGALARLYERK